MGQKAGKSSSTPNSSSHSMPPCIRYFSGVKTACTTRSSGGNSNVSPGLKIISLALLPLGEHVSPSADSSAQSWSNIWFSGTIIHNLIPRKLRIHVSVSASTWANDDAPAKAKMVKSGHASMSATFCSASCCFPGLDSDFERCTKTSRRPRRTIWVS